MRHELKRSLAAASCIAALVLQPIIMSGAYSRHVVRHSSRLCLSSMLFLQDEDSSHHELPMSSPLIGYYTFRHKPEMMPELVPDVLQLVFQQLAGDNAFLLNVSLTCRAWQSLAVPFTYQVVDVSSHNNGRQPQYECECQPMVHAEDDGDYRPSNLVSRQRAFLRLMTDKPELRVYVNTFTWTLIWMDFDEDSLTDVDRQTWSIFAGMVNVTHLDLAALHHVTEDEYVRQNPPKLFPKVRDLRLLGWMHRGLVRAVITSLDPRKLQSLKLDYLEDEGAFPNGESLGSDSAIMHAHHARRSGISFRPEAMNESRIYSEESIRGQETGNAFVFPGPMWLPLYLLSTHAMVSCTHLRIKVPPFSEYIDLRNYTTLFRQIAIFITRAKETLRSVTLVMGVTSSVLLYPLWDGCSTHPDVRPKAANRHWCAIIAMLFLRPLLVALNGNAFPQLEEIHCEGFQINEAFTDGAEPEEYADVIIQLIRYCDLTNTTFTEIDATQGRQSYHGHDRRTEDGRFAEYLANS